MPLVRCKTEGFDRRPGCGPIFLPYPNPPALPQDQPQWPKDNWKATVVCNCCGLGSEYTAPDVEWYSSPIPALSPLVLFFEVEIKCADSNCEVPVLLYINFDTSAKTEDMDAKVRNGSRKATCRAGHGALLPLEIRKTDIALEIK